ncbi:MAG: DUF2284 domain-containing protein [Thermodesulfobacteriota bacterium]
MTPPTHTDLEALIHLARSLGASEAQILASRDIPVEDHLADLCREPQCRNFGQSPSCPPHVGGPEAFRKFQMNFPQAIIVRLIVPSSVLFSNERRGIMGLLHEIVAGIEQEAVQGGFSRAKAFAGGSCKQIFCQDQEDCQVLSNGGKCRNPDQARPSLSGFGINVSQLMKVCGWPAEIKSKTESLTDPLSWVAGLVLLG